MTRSINLKDIPTPQVELFGGSNVEALAASDEAVIRMLALLALKTFYDRQEYEGRLDKPFVPPTLSRYTLAENAVLGEPSLVGIHFESHGFLLGETDHVIRNPRVAENEPIMTLVSTIDSTPEATVGTELRGASCMAMFRLFTAAAEDSAP